MLLHLVVTSFTVLTCLFCLPALALLEASADNNTAEFVHLRIEGSKQTIFEGRILTRGHVVSTPSGGAHECNGLNNHTNPLPGPTPTTALDDASRVANFTFDG